MAANATAVMVAFATASDGGRRWPGTVLITASAIAFSLAGLFTRLIDLDVWTVLFWRSLFGGIFIAGYIVWREGRRVLPAIRQTGIAGVAVTISSALATICFINALRQTSVADVLVINATAPFITAALAYAWTADREHWTTLAASLVALAGVAQRKDARLSSETAGERADFSGDLRPGPRLPDAEILMAHCRTPPARGSVVDQKLGQRI